jgi:hypothetical protein
MATSPRSSHHPRRSRCIDQSRSYERERIERLSVEERIELALSLKQRFAELLPHPGPDERDVAPPRPA